VVIEVEPAASREMRFDVASAIDLAAEGIDHLEVALTYGDREERRLLDPAAPRTEAVFWFEPELGSAIGVGWEAHLTAGGGSDGGAIGLHGVVDAPPFTTDRRIVRLDPRQLYQARPLRVLAQGVPFDRFPRVLVDLRIADPAAGWSEQRTVELAADRLEEIVPVRAALGARLVAERRLRYLETDGGEVVRDWERVELSGGGTLVVGDPLPEVVDVLVLGAARFGTAVRRLVVELRPAADPARVAARVLTAEEPSASWSFEPAPGAGGAAAEPARAYEYRVTVHTARGELREGQWLPGPPGKLIVGEGGRQRQVELLFVGRSPADLGLLALKVRFAFADPEAGLEAEDELLVEETRQPLKWSYPEAHPDSQRYSYQLTLIHADGRMETRDPVATSDLLAIQPL
jgi:hypothetical protein